MPIELLEKWVNTMYTGMARAEMRACLKRRQAGGEDKKEAIPND